MSAEEEIPQVPLRGDTWQHREKPGLLVEVLGRTADQVVIEAVDTTLLNGHSFPLALFVRHFQLYARPS